MSIFDCFPLSNAYAVNLDWIMRKIREIEKYVQDYTAVNKVAYAGVWDITKQYPQWALVTDGNTSWLSNKPVPVGIPLENEEYWQKLADLDPRIAGLVVKVAALEKAMKDKIPEKSFFASAILKELTDCSVKLSELRNCTLFVDAGTYPITTECTIDKSVTVIFCGGIFSNSAKITIPVFTAGNYQILTSANVALGNGCIIGKAEWFGAVPDGVTDCSPAFNMSVSALGGVVLSSGDYRISRSINITKAFEIRGEKQWNATTKYSAIVSESDLAIKIYSAAPTLEAVVIKNFAVRCPGSGSIGVSLIGTNRAIVDNVFVYNASIGFEISRNVGLSIRNCNVYVDFVGDSVGFKLTGTAYNDWPFVADNASLFIDNCRYIGLANNIKNATGIRGYNSNGDVFIKSFEASQVNVGISLEGSNSTGSNADILIDGCIIDIYQTAGISLVNMQPCSCIVTNCYVAPKDNPENYSDGILISGVWGCTVSNCNVWGGYLTNSVKCRGINVFFSKQISLMGNVISGFNPAILIFGKSIGVISANTINDYYKDIAINVLNSGTDAAENILILDFVINRNISVNGNVSKVCIDSVTKNNSQFLLNGNPVTETTAGLIIR